MLCVESRWISKGPYYCRSRKDTIDSVQTEADCKSKCIGSCPGINWNTQGGGYCNICTDASPGTQNSAGTLWVRTDTDSSVWLGLRWARRLLRQPILFMDDFDWLGHHALLQQLPDRIRL